MNPNLIETRWRGIPVHIHWSVLLFLPWYWLHHYPLKASLVALPAYVLLVLVHEMGHALMAHWRHTRVFAIKVFVLHGVCEHAPAYHEEDDIYIAWGGVLAQALLYLAAVLALPLLQGLPYELRALVAPAFGVFTTVNVATAILNLIPIAPLDGARAWRLLPLLPALARGRVAALRRRLARWRRARWWPGRRKALRESSARTTADIMRRMREH